MAHILGRTWFPLVEGRDFLFSGNCFLSFRASFLQVETISETSLNKLYSVHFITARSLISN